MSKPSDKLNDTYVTEVLALTQTVATVEVLMDDRPYFGLKIIFPDGTWQQHWISKNRLLKRFPKRP